MGKLTLNNTLPGSVRNHSAQRMMGSNDINNVKTMKSKDRDCVTLKTVKDRYCFPAQIQPKA